MSSHFKIYLTTTLALAALLYLAGCGEDNPPATNTAPEFGQSTYSFTLAENAESGDEIGSVSATDADENATLTYSITTTQTDFAINGGTGSVTVAEATLDFETTNSYTLQVQVSDGTDTDTADITITITDVNEFVPEFANDSYEFEIVADVKSGDEVGKITATDADGTAQLTYSIDSEGAANFAITAGTNVASGEEATVTVAADADLPSLTSPVELTITVSDGENTVNATAEIVITPVGTGTNAAPVFSNTPYTFNVASDAADGAVVGMVSATDEDEGAMLTYSLSGTEAGSFAISNTAVASGEEVSITVATNADLPSLTSPVALTVEVSDGTDQVTANVEITIIAGNVAPVFDQTAYTFTIASGAASETVVGTISATDSNTGDLLAYSLSGTDAGHFEIKNGTDVTSGTDVSITVAANANLSSLTNPVMLTIEVSDGTDQVTATVAITIIAGNVAPVFASTSYNFTVASGASEGDLVGTVSATDSNDGDLLAYSLSGEGADNFAIDHAAVASDTDVSVTVAAGADLSSLGGSVTLTATVTDDATPALTADVAVEITITAGNVAPVFASTDYAFSVASDAAAETPVGTVSATDSNDGDMLIYSLSDEGADNFAISNAAVASGTDVPITVAASANLSSLTSPVKFIVTVADDETPALTATANVEITITAGNVAPVFASTDYAFSVASDAAAETPVGTVSATDSNDGDMLIYSLSDEGADNFAISNAAVASGTDVPITVATNADLPSLTSPVTLTVTVADDETPALMATANVEITILEGNVAPVFGQAAYTFSIDEDASSGDVVDAVSATDSNAGDLLIYTISGEGAGNFAIDNTAVASGTPVPITVSSTAALDHETTPSYTLEVQASDDDAPALTATAAVTINVNDVNDNDPAFAQASYLFNVNENSPASTLVGTVAATDADAGTTLEYSIAPSQTDFDINANGEITVGTSATLDFETTTSYTLEVEASDGTKTATAEVTINVNDLNDNAPVFTGAPYTFNVNENSAASTMVGTVVATDADAGTTLAYRITTTPTDFDIDSGTGEMTVASAVLDFETTTSYTLEVQASDGAMPALTATAEVTINVNNLNDNDPVFGQTAYTFEIEGAKALSGDEVGTVAAMDADAGTTLEYSIANTPTEFDIDANTGIITVSDAAALSTATPSYALTVEASDGANMGTATLTITIVGVDYDVDGDGLIDINNLEQLNAMRWDLDGDGMSTNAGYAAAFPDAATYTTTPTGYELMRSLDFDVAGSYGSGALNTAWSTNTGEGWDPIGDFALEAANNAPFVAVFAGNDHTISNLYINRGSEDYVGLFGHVGAPGTVRDVGLLDVDITGNSFVGGLVGVNNNSGTGTITIENSYATGNVTGDTNVGGLIGNSQNTSTGTVTIRACYAECTVMGIGDGVNVGTGDNVGGLVGLNFNSGTGATLLITACYATGNVTGTGEAVGGLVGQNDITSTSTILMTACYATGNVTGTGESVGGLVGQNLNRGTFTLTACYARGAVTGTVTFIGGLVGDNIFGTITASYFDFSINSGLTQGDEGKTTDELRMPTGYAGIYADWNVDVDGATGADDPWDFGTADDYPVLKVDFNNDGSTADDVTRQRQ